MFLVTPNGDGTNTVETAEEVAARTGDPRQRQLLLDIAKADREDPDDCNGPIARSLVEGIASGKLPPLPLSVRRDIARQQPRDYIDPETGRRARRMDTAEYVAHWRSLMARTDLSREEIEHFQRWIGRQRAKFTDPSFCASLDHDDRVAMERILNEAELAFAEMCP